MFLALIDLYVMSQSLISLYVMFLGLTGLYVMFLRVTGLYILVRSPTIFPIWHPFNEPRFIPHIRMSVFMAYILYSIIGHNYIRYFVCIDTISSEYIRQLAPLSACFPCTITLVFLDALHPYEDKFV